MGLFTKKDPCPICGNKLPMLFVTKIEGVGICKECSEKIDLPDAVEEAMTMEEFHCYLAFYEENQRLKEQFTITQSISFGLFGTQVIVDEEHGWFCMSNEPDKTVLEGARIRSFTVREDDAVVIYGDPTGVTYYEIGRAHV